ncbi:winged helix-turn-helix transcriptional regulator, partial [Treponema denticola]
PIIKYLKENPEISYEQLAEKMGKSRATISRKISELKKAGIIKRIGADKNGYWQIIDEK